MKDDFLTNLRETPEPEFAASLYQRISKPVETQTARPTLRFAALTLSAVAVLTATLLFSPSARTFAQGLLRQIGGFAFSQGVPGPLDASKLPAAFNIIYTSTSISIELSSDSIVANDAATASDLAGFAVLTPSYLPSGYVPMDGDWRITPENDSTAVSSGYFDGTKNFFLIVQWKVGEAGTKTFTREEIVDVNVHSQTGVWLPKASPDGSSSALVWGENGVTYSIISNALPLNEVLKVAESLGQ